MLALLLACNQPDSTQGSKWEVTQEVCQPPDPFVRPMMSPPALDSSCEDALLSDLSVEQDGFTDVALSQLVEGLYALLGRDAGQEPVTDDYIRSSFVDLLGADSRGVTPAAYDFVTGMVQRTVYGDNPDEWVMGFDWSTGTLTVSEDDVADAIETASRLVHEAGHGYTQEGHVECSDGSITCDPDWSESLGFEAGIAESYGLNVPDDDPDAINWRTRASRAADNSADLILEN